MLTQVCYPCEIRSRFENLYIDRVPHADYFRIPSFAVRAGGSIQGLSRIQYKCSPYPEKFRVLHSRYHYTAVSVIKYHPTCRQSQRSSLNGRRIPQLRQIHISVLLNPSLSLHPAGAENSNDRAISSEVSCKPR